MTQEKGHGRIETREYYLCTDPDFLKLHGEWRDLRGVGMMKSRIIQGKTTTEETHYYISSLENVREFSIAARSHWGVENSLHWCLDVTFREDHSRMRKDNTAENFAVVRHIVLNILKLKNNNQDENKHSYSLYVEAVNNVYNHLFNQGLGLCFGWQTSPFFK